MTAAVRRRDRQRDETRRDLASAAFQLAISQGLAEVRVPEIAAAAGVSTRTFNNYFTSKEEAIVWPARERAVRIADGLLARPAGEALGPALVAAVTGSYQDRRPDGLPPNWLRDFRELVAREPALHGEWLRVASAGEQTIAHAIAQRLRVPSDGLRPRVLAAVVVGAERAAVMHWMRQPGRKAPLVGTVRRAIQLALAGVESR